MVQKSHRPPGINRGIIYNNLNWFAGFLPKNPDKLLGASTSKFSPKGMMDLCEKTSMCFFACLFNVICGRIPFFHIRRYQFSHIGQGSMGLVYLPTFTIKINWNPWDPHGPSSGLEAVDFRTRCTHDASCRHLEKFRTQWGLESLSSSLSSNRGIRDLGGGYINHLEPQTTIYKWVFGETTIFYIKIWNHPIETTIYKGLFGVPGNSLRVRPLKKGPL